MNVSGKYENKPLDNLQRILRFLSTNYHKLSLDLSGDKARAPRRGALRKGVFFYA